MSINQTAEPKTQQCYEWRGAASIPLVIAELEMGVPLSRVARKFGISRQWLRQALDKERGATATSGPGVDSGKETPAPAESEFTKC